MRKLLLQRKTSGIHSVHTQDGQPLGVVDPADFELDDDELQNLMRKHAAKKVAQNAVDDFLEQVKNEIRRTGATYRQALDEVSRRDPLLASEYRLEVLRSSELL